MKCDAIVCDDDGDDCDAVDCDDYLLLLQKKTDEKMKPEVSLWPKCGPLPYARRCTAMRNINKLIMSSTNYGRQHAERCALFMEIISSNFTYFGPSDHRVNS